MKTETLPCGCVLSFGAKGDIRGVVTCTAHDGLFSEDKSLKQLVMDIQHQTLTSKYTPKPAEPATVEPAPVT